MDEDREAVAFKFDVACALGVLAHTKNLPVPLPETLTLPPEAQKILDECVEPNSFERSSCKIRLDLHDNGHSLRLGQDSLHLKPGGWILGGGSGVTVQLHDASTDRSFALKVPRLSVLAYERESGNLGERLDKIFEIETTAFENERQRSRRLAHHNIAQHLFGDTRQIRRPGIIFELPFSLAEWIPGAKPLDQYLMGARPNMGVLIDLIAQTLEAVEYLRSQDVIHWDLKVDNIIVGDDHTIRIIDFGSAKSLVDLDLDADIIATTTEGKYPQHVGFRAADKDLQGSRRFEVTLPHITWNDHFLDLWMLGQEWNRCLGIAPDYLEDQDDALAGVRDTFANRLERGNSPRDQGTAECLALIFSRLLSPLSEQARGTAQGSDKAFDKTKVYYQNAAEVLAELGRVKPLLGAGQEVHELLVSLGDIVRLPVTGNSVFTDRVGRLVNTPMARRTKLHLQLAQVREVFPGATHVRFEHLLGTVTTASYVLRSLYLNEANAFWRVSASEQDVKAIILAALLHDVGHLSFGHFIEEMKDLFQDVGHVDFVRAFIRRCRDLAVGKKGTTAAANRDFIIEDSEVSSFFELIREDWCSAEEEAAPLLDQVLLILDNQPLSLGIDHLTRHGTRSALDASMRTIVSGPLDADKIDYLRRDSAHSGVMFANGIDLERFFESLRICIRDESSGSPVAALGVSEKGLAAVETVITARYHLFSAVYWHRTVRCITAMLQRVISEVFMAASEAEWHKFRKDMLFEFRTRDDRQALSWLREELAGRFLLERPIERTWRQERDGASSHETFGSLLDALDGDRDQYFDMAFELSYSGVVGSQGHGSTPNAELHEKIAQRFYGILGGGTGKYDEIRAAREDASSVRYQLQQKFADVVNRLPHVREALADRLFTVDTILIDVPESGKDQMEGLHVDRRSKRTRRKVTLCESGDWYPPAADIEDIGYASPIAAALRDVFNHWARRLRVFMTKRDLLALEGLGFTYGDVGAIWEKILYDFFELEPGKQYLMKLGVPK